MKKVLYVLALLEDFLLFLNFPVFTQLFIISDITKDYNQCHRPRNSDHCTTDYRHWYLPSNQLILCRSLSYSLYFWLHRWNYYNRSINRFKQSFLSWVFHWSDAYQSAWVVMDDVIVFKKGLAQNPPVLGWAINAKCAGSINKVIDVICWINLDPVWTKSNVKRNHFRKVVGANKFMIVLSI